MTQQEFTNRYQFNLREDKIGGGSFGTVYKAYDNVLDREVAIKVSEVKHVGDKEFSLLEEFKAIENVPANKYIANYEEVFRFESFQGVFDYGLMQYYPLGNLSSYLKNNTVSQTEKEKLVLGILDGIGYLHKHKVVHRDLKPSNILVVDRQGELIPKITDFGLSKQASTDAKGSRFTNSFAGGTLQYSSPEQLKGLPLKLNTDLWSFGVIAYEILTGNTLFETQSNSTASAEWQNEITQKILHEDVSSQLEELPVKWQSVMKACLERDLTQRIQNTDAILVLLNNEEITQPKRFKPVIPNNNETVVKSNSENREGFKNTSSKTETLPKQVRKKRFIPALITIVVIVFSVIGYFMFNKTTVNLIIITFTLFEQDGLYGYKLGDSIAIPAQYDQARSFKNNMALVTVKDSSYYINKKGQWIGRYKTIENTNNIKQQLERLYNNSNQYQNFRVIDSSKYLVLQKNILDTLSSYNIDQNKKLIIKQQLERLYNNSNQYQNFKVIDTSKYLVLQKNILDMISIYGVAQNKKKTINKNEEPVKTKSEIVNKQGEKQKSAIEKKEKKPSEDLNAIYAEALRLFNQEKYEEAYPLLLKSAKSGNLKAQDNLGLMYYLGLGVKENETEAIMWYQKAANQGYDDAQFNLGEIYNNRFHATKDDFAESIKWYKKAANQGYINAQFNLARFYKKKGVSQNYTEALNWLRKAADQGDAVSQFNIGYMYFKGQGVTQSISEAKLWYKKACDNGNQDACVYYKNIDQ